mgnify:CR=1 FL=1
MLLAGGQGSRLYALTESTAKPAVTFGAKYRIIDFPLTNCIHSGIDTVGVLIQYKPSLLNRYLGTGAAWDLDAAWGGVHILPPYATQTGGEWYEGTADAIYHNIDFLDGYDPEYVIILSGDHLYQMDYNLMLDFHKLMGADLTVAVKTVPWEEASRFGIMSVDQDMRITRFAEKPKKPESNLASMGIYIFSADVLIEALEEDALDQRSSHDFGKDIIPKLLGENKRLYSYEFHGFWKDVGTIASFHETSMDLLGNNPEFDLFDKHFPIMSNITTRPPHYIGPDGRLDDCLVSNGCKIYGTVKHSVLSAGVVVEEGATVEDAVLMDGVVVKAGAVVKRCILAENVVVGAGAKIGGDGPIAHVGTGLTIGAGAAVKEGAKVFDSVKEGEEVC